MLEAKSTRGQVQEMVIACSDLFRDPSPKGIGDFEAVLQVVVSLLSRLSCSEELYTAHAMEDQCPGEVVSFACSIWIYIDGVHDECLDRLL